MWPIKAKGKVTRLTPLGDPQVEKNYHAALEQGRHLEHALGDANHWLAERKREVLARIQVMMDINKVAVNAKPGDHLRRILLTANSITFLKEVANFQQEITGLIQAVTQNIGMIQSMEQNMLQMVQANLNAVANLLNNICNWGLPDLPAIPNFFSDTVWYWNGFNFFPLSSFQPHVGFDKNFSFNMCVIHVPNINIFRNYPSTVTSIEGLQYGTPAFVPPLGGVIPNTGQNLSDPNFVAQMQVVSNIPVYGPDFNPKSSMLGAVPDPATIINNFQMLSADYRHNIVSIVPQTRVDTVEPTDADYNNPNLTVRQPKLRADLVHFTTLQQVVASNFDPNLTAQWLFYLDNTRTGRGGTWIKNFQDLYTTLIVPSVAYLATNNIPWNQVLPGGTISNGPTAIPLIATLQNAPDPLEVYWQLSYIEAALLGYTRTKDWDGHASLGYVDGFTGTDLDYRATVIDPTVTQTILLGAETAEFPSSCTFPSAIAAVLSTVIEKAKADIANTPTFRSPHPQFRFTFDSFANATEVDRFSQFWREFNSNLQLLLIQDPFLVGFVTTYPASLESAVNPLGDPTDFNIIKTDVASRNRTWVPGTPLIDIPVAPIVTFSSTTLPTDATNGWQGLDLDPAAFLARPDIQSLPIPVQTAMLRTNLSFAAISKFRDAMTAETATQLATAATTIAQTNVGFHVTLVSGVGDGFGYNFGNNFGQQTQPSSAQTVPVATIQPLSFSQVDFDISNYVVPLPPATPPTLAGVALYNEFTIQAAGTYAIAGELDWTSLGTGVRSAIVYVNGVPIFEDDTDPLAGPTVQQFSTIGQFKLGDVVSVYASHGLSVPQTIGSGFFTMTIMQPDANAGGGNISGSSTTLSSFTAAVNMVAGTVVAINSTGEVQPVDPTVVVKDANGNVIFPFADGIVVSNVTAGNLAQVATLYGEIFSIPSLNLTPGALMYVGKGGIVTQDYLSLINGATPPGANAAVGPVQWVICIGRAFTPAEFLWEPHIPTRFNMTF